VGRVTSATRLSSCRKAIDILFYNSERLTFEGIIAMKTDHALRCLQAGQRRLEKAIEAQDTLLRTISEQLDRLLERLTIQPDEGQELQELSSPNRRLAEGVVVRRIDRGTRAMTEAPSEEGVVALRARDEVANFNPHSDNDPDRLLIKMEQLILDRFRKRSH
jgi:hypothetical protein